jgi:hypothetical protein
MNDPELEKFTKAAHAIAGDGIESVHFYAPSSGVDSSTLLRIAAAMLTTEGRELRDC